MQAILCDKCGKIIPKRRFGILSATFPMLMESITIKEGLTIDAREIELCVTCTKDFMSWVDGEAGTNDETEGRDPDE